MRSVNDAHRHERLTAEDDTSLDVETMITGIAVLRDMHDELPAWGFGKDEIMDITDQVEEWVLDKARQERFIRSVGILATLDADKLDELVEAKRITQAETAA